MMTQAEAMRTVAVLVAAYRGEMTEETAAIWANSLQGREAVDVLEAVQIIAETSLHMPSLAGLLAVASECRNDRILREAKPVLVPPGVSFAAFLRDNDDARATVERILQTKVRPGWGPTVAQSGLQGMLGGRRRRGR